MTGAASTGPVDADRQPATVGSPALASQGTRRASPGWLVGGSIAAVAVTLSLLWLTDAIEPAAVAGLPDPGAVTRWGLPTVKAIRDVAATVCVGTIIAVVALLPTGSRRGELTATQFALVQLAGWAALAWSTAAFAEVALTYSEVSAEPVSRTGPVPLLQFVNTVDVGRAIALTGLLAAMIAFLATFVHRVGGAGVMLVVAVAALWSIATTGHAAGDADHDLGVTTQFLHVSAAAVWVGGLFAVFLVHRRDAADSGVLRRYSRLAGWAWLVVGASGLVAAWLRVPSWGSLLGPYGYLLALKVLAFGLLGLAGLAHRRRVLARSERPGSRFTRLAAGELVVMAGTIGVAVALSRSEPPDGEVVALDPATALLGFPMPPALGAAEWFTQWRLDPLWGTVAVVLLIGYLTGVRRLRRRGDSWSWGRLTAWVVGCLGLLWATSGAPGVYGEVLFSMHMVQHMTIATAVPTFFVLGAPATLALRSVRRRRDGSRGPREWLLAILHSWPVHLLSHPIVASALFIVGLVAFYYSALFELSLETHTGHVLMTGHFLLTGYLFANVICGVDPGPPRPAYPMRMLLLMATFGFHAFFSVSLMASKTVLAVDWFTQLDREWGSTLLRDQYLGASLGWALGDYPLAILAAALVWNWVRADRREGRRRDRHVDRYGDAELESYNSYLRGIAAQETPTDASKRPSQTGTAGGNRH